MNSFSKHIFLLCSQHLLVSYIHEHLRSLEESRGALQTDVEENAALGEAMKLLVGERCLPVELERYNLFIGDLERVVNLLLCLSARLARVQNALSVVDQHTDAEEKVGSPFVLVAFGVLLFLDFHFCTALLL